MPVSRPAPDELTTFRRYDVIGQDIFSLEFTPCLGTYYGVMYCGQDVLDGKESTLSIPEIWKS